MTEIRHRVVITADRADVFTALSTIDGLAAWWTRDTRGDAAVGGKIEFYFGGPDAAAVMEVVECTEPERVVWRCVDGPSEWIDTTFTYELTEADDHTVLMFTNEGWREPVEFMHHCSTRWGYFLLSLKHGLEGRTATPFPDDLKF